MLGENGDCIWEKSSHYINDLLFFFFYLFIFFFELVMLSTSVHIFQSTHILQSVNHIGLLVVF